MNPLASLTVTYLVGAVVSAILFFILNRGTSIAVEYSHISPAPVLLGIAVVGLEAGYIYAYRNGWSVGTAQIVQSVILAVVLLVIGRIFYKEPLTAKKLIGAAICLAGLCVMNI